MNYGGLIKRYRRYLQIDENTRIITLNEGNTPLIRSMYLENQIHSSVKLFFKYEGSNPTGSFKDRGMTMAVTKAVQEGSKCVICASTGNTSASAAAYAARAGIKSVVLIPDNKIAVGKLAQAMVYGAEIIAVDGNFDDALEMVKKLSGQLPITLVNSINPNRIEGQKTAAFEICDQLGTAPDYLSIPIGNAGNITAYWKGFKQYNQDQIIDKLPVMIGFQAAGAAPLVEGKPISNPETIATAIRIGNPASWDSAQTALKESAGCVNKVTDNEILNAYEMLASKEGVFAEPASCASVAGMLKLAQQGYFREGSTIVCILTGNGLKDPDTAVQTGEKPPVLPSDYSVLHNRLEILLGGGKIG